MILMIIPDLHLEYFKREERKIIIDKLKEEIIRVKPEVIIFNGDFWRGGKRNRSKAISLLYRIEKSSRRKVIHFPGSHEDFSHAYKFLKYFDFVYLVPGSQLVARGNFKPIHINFEEVWEDLAKWEMDLIITHDPFPHTVDITMYFEFENGAVTPVLYYVKSMYNLYLKDKKMRKKIDKMKIGDSIDDTFIEILREILTLMDEMENIILNKARKMEYREDIIEKILYTLGKGSLVIGHAKYFEEWELIKYSIEEKGTSMVVSGHIHENFLFNDQVVNENGTKFVNPGPAFLGFYCLINTDKEKIDLRNFAIKDEKIFRKIEKIRAKVSQDLLEIEQPL